MTRAAALASLLAAALAPAAAAQGGTPPAPPAASSPADGARPISLDEAIRLAQRNAPAAVQTRGPSPVNCRTPPMFSEKVGLNAA